MGHHIESVKRMATPDDHGHGPVRHVLPLQHPQHLLVREYHG